MHIAYISWQSTLLLPGLPLGWQKKPQLLVLDAYAATTTKALINADLPVWSQTVAYTAII